MPQNKKILICSEYFWPYGDSSTGYYMTEIADKLSDFYKVEVCTVHNSKVGSNKDTKQKKKYRISRIGISSSNSDGFLIRGLKHLLLGLKFFLFQLRNTKKNDELFIVTNPSSLIISSWLVKLIKGCKLTVLIYDIFPESLVSVGVLNKNNLIYKILLDIFNRAYLSADILISIGDDMTEYLNNKLPIYRGSIIKITNWSETEVVTPLPKESNEILSNLSLSSEIIFTFAGNIGRVQNVPFLLESVKKCDIENVHFLFIGGGAMVKEVELLSKNHNNISYAGSFGRDEQNNFLSACDIAIVSLSKGMAGLGVPSKTYNILASGKPILFLGEENTEIATMIKDNDIGWVIDQDNHLGFLNAIRMISQDPVNFKEKGVRSRELALKKYKKDLILNKYVDLFKAN